jgi:hypothetical protein
VFLKPLPSASQLILIRDDYASTDFDLGSANEIQIPKRFIHLKAEFDNDQIIQIIESERPKIVVWTNLFVKALEYAKRSHIVNVFSSHAADWLNTAFLKEEDLDWERGVFSNFDYVICDDFMTKILDLLEVNSDSRLPIGLPQFDCFFNKEYYGADVRKRILAYCGADDRRQPVLVFYGSHGKYRSQLGWLDLWKETSEILDRVLKLAKKNDFTLLFRPKLWDRGTIPFLTARQKIKWALRSRNSNLHIADHLISPYRFFFADSLLINQESSLEVEGICANRNVLTTQLNQKSDYLRLDSYGLRRRIDNLSDMEDAILESFQKPQFTEDSRRKYLAWYCPHSVDSKCTERLQNYLLQLLK